MYEKFKSNREIDFHNEISTEFAVLTLCKVLGFKKPSRELKDKLIIWSERSADSAQHYPIDENANYYIEAH